MSSYAVIAGVSEALRRVLWSEYQADPDIQPLVQSSSAISFKNPTDTKADSALRLSLWLHHITENEFLRNQPMERTTRHDVLQHPPLALNLNYLVTPFTNSGEADHLLLGKTMQVLYDHAIFLLRDTVTDLAEELRIVLCRLNIEELTRIWEALRESYRLSLCYQVRVTRIDSTRLENQPRVVDPALDLATSGNASRWEVVRA